MKNLSQILSILIILCAVSIISANAQITSVSQLTDVKPTDSHYAALQALIEKYDVFQPYPDGSFRADAPLTRGEFVKLLHRSLDRFIEVVASEEVGIESEELFNMYSANKLKITSIGQIKDIRPTNEFYVPIEALIEKYGIDLVDADYNFRPNQAVTEKEFYTWIAEIFSGKNSAELSATKTISRGVWVIVMDQAFDAIFGRINSLVEEKSAEKAEEKPTPTVSPNSTPQVSSKPKDLEKSMKEAEDYEKAGDFANALMTYKETGNAAWNAPTEMKCGIAIHRIAKKLIERDNGNDPLSESRREDHKEHLSDAIDLLSSALSSDKNLVEAYQTRAATYRLLNKVKEAEADEQKVKELGGNSSQTSSILEIIQNLPSRGKAQIVKKLQSYSPGNNCVDLSSASNELKEAFKDGGIWGDYRIDNKQIGDIIFEANSACESGEKIVLLRIGTAIVTMTEKGIKRLK